MAPIIRKVHIINNKGIINFGNKGNLSPTSFTKMYSGSGGDNSATILNGKKMNSTGIAEQSIESMITSDELNSGGEVV
jgi:hypothetical protein